jgi:hypothetical protein
MKTAIGFRPEFLDFQRGIRVGNLEERERITRILKIALESRYGESFVTERWGRGVFWRWIGYLSRANRAAKPVSSNVSFGCAKFFLSMNPEEQLFQCEGFRVRGGSWDGETAHLSDSDFAGAAKLRRALDAAPKNQWAGFQLYYPMRQEEVRSATGLDLVESMLAVFREVTPAMNLCMQTQLKTPAGRGEGLL